MCDLVADASLDLEKTYEYILSIQVRLNGFSFSISSNRENKIVAFKTTNLKISSSSLISRRFKEWVETEELLQKPFKKISIVVFSNKYTLIPEHYSRDELKREIPRLLFEENGELEVAENSISKLKIRLIFALPTGLNRVITELIGVCEIVHPIKIILNNLPAPKNKIGLVLLFDTKDFYITLFDEGKVLLTNNFKMAHANDVVYFVLTTLKQMGFLPGETELFITEAINEFPDIEKYLQPYFTEIKKLELTRFKLELGAALN